MTRLLDFIRRHPRLSGGVAVILLAAIATIAVRASGPAHAAPDTAHATASGIAVASASLPSVRPATTRTATASVSKSPRRSTSASRVAHHGGASIRPGIATAPATSRGVALALRAATGLSPSQVTTRQVCAPASGDQARCAAEALVLRATGAVVHPRVQHSSSGGPTEGDSPAFLQQAYDLSSLSQNAGSGDTVALIDAYNDSTAQADLNAYRSNYGLSACTTTNGCFREINEWGGSSLPTTSATAEGWDYEISLDLDTVSAICPNCHILLVEARSSNSTDLERAMQSAASDGATQISDSWTMQSSTAPAADFVPSGVPIVAATGDDGYVGPGEDNYPAGLPGVTAAGGTSLAPSTGTPSGRGFGETAWSGAGSGCDVNEPQPAYQTGGACGGRAYADVSADADPDTGLAVYDSAEGGWVEVGGTSLASPMIAAYYAITGVNGSDPAWAYGDSGELNDITSGSNGSCAIAYICTAGVGYDGPTGVGSISGDVVAGAPGIGGGTIPTGQSTPTNTQTVAAKTATIAGGIYPNQTDTTWWIQYGTSAHYGLQTPQTDIGAGSTAVPVTGELSQLAPNTTYYYRLVAQNSLGTVDGTTYSFTTLPSSSFTFSPTAPTPSSQVSFTADPTEGSASTLSYAWSFGDGQTQTTTGQTVRHSYASNGVYTVSLTVTNGAHQSTTTTQTVTVDNPPTAAFTPSASVGGATSVSFDGSGSRAGAGSSISDYSWNFGDGSTQDTGTTSTAQHTFAAPGVYSVALTTTDEFNVSNTVTKNVIAGAFAATTTTPTEGTAITFNVPSLTGIDGTISDYSWNFGDGSSSQDTGTTPSATYTYSQRGAYTVTLTITTSSGQTATGTETITVDTPPTPAFAASAPVTGATAVSFDGSGSAADTGGSIADYSWNYGDGATADTGSTSTAAHTFANSGIYPVTLTTTDDLGVSNTVTQNVIAGAFTASTNVPAPGAPVTFSVPSLAGVNGTITDYSWSFGDGSTEDTGPTPSVTYTYSQRDDYTVALTITTSTGQTATGTETIAVDNPPTAALDSSNSTAVAAPDQTVGFNGSQSAAEAGSIESYTWNFGDGTTPVTSDSPTASHTYASPGRYTATLTVTDDLGVSDTTAATEQVVVDQPDAALAGPTTTVAPDALASFNAGSSSDPEGTITDYSWQFGDGATLNTGTTPTATHLYTQRGHHTVTVTVTNSYGQTGSTQRTVTIDASPTAAFTPSTTLTTTGNAVGFDASASAAMAGGSIADYSWNYGDGSGQDTGTAPDAEHNYGAPGTYTVTLTTTDDLGLSATASAQVTIQAPAATTTSTPTPTPVATSKPLTASLSGAKKQKLAPTLTHGLRVSLAVNQSTRSTFQVTLPVLESKLAHSAKNKKASLVLLRTGAQTLGAGNHAITLKLSRAAARELAGSGPLVLTVKVTLTEANGATVTRSLKITLAR
jgi:PKD repeat protein